MTRFSNLGTCSEHFDVQVFLAAQVAGTTLDDLEFVVESFDAAERGFIVRLAVGGNAVRVVLDRGSELSERLEPLPAQRLTPLKFRQLYELCNYH